MISRLSLYDTDFFAWSQEQAELLRSGRASEADLAVIADEIESMGKSERRAIVSRLAVLILHLLKWERQPALRGASWRLSVANARDALADLFSENHSLRTQGDTLIVAAYRYARRQAAAETGVPEAALPSACPWPLETLLDETFWPE
jgi:hypothetical protein